MLKQLRSFMRSSGSDEVTKANIEFVIEEVQFWMEMLEIDECCDISKNAFHYWMVWLERVKTWQN